MIFGPSFETLRAAWHRFVRLWRPMAWWTLLTWGLVVVPLAPFSSLVLGLGWLRGRRSIVGNEELLDWGLTVPGAIWALLAGGLLLVAGVVRYAGIFHIVTDDLEGRKTGLRQTALDLVPRVPSLLRLCLAAAAAGGVLALMLFAGLVLIRAALLGNHDINYYLSYRPSEWFWAVALGALWILAMGTPALYLLGRIGLALPAYLDGHRPLRMALRESWQRTRGQAPRLVRALGLAVGIWLLSRGVASAVYVAVGSAAVNALSGISMSLTPLVLATGVYVLGLLVLDAVIAFTGFAFLATVLTKVYYEDTDLHALAPPRQRVIEMPARAIRRLRDRLRPSVLVPLAALALLASAALSAVAIARMPEVRPVVISAHRAGPAPAPENTLAALERAIAAGAHMAEIDVQRTSDGVVIVAHDADLMRVAGDPRRIRDTAYGDMADVVQRPDDGSPPGERTVATLTELLARARDRIGLMIELKYYGSDPGLVPATLRVVREAGMEDQVVVMSLDYSAVEQAAALAPEIRTGYVAAATVGDPLSLPVSFLALARSRIDSRLVRMAHRRDVEIHAWTVNAPAEMADLMELGVDGLITDDPATARRVADQLTDMSPAARLLLRVRDLWDDEGVEDTPIRE